MPWSLLEKDKREATELRRGIRVALVDADMKDVANALGCSLKTAYNRKNNPESLKVSELRKLCKSVRMTAEDKDKLRKLIVP